MVPSVMDLHDNTSAIFLLNAHLLFVIRSIGRSTFLRNAFDNRTECFLHALTSLRRSFKIANGFGLREFLDR
jgi:hypothetical protein